MAFQWNINPTGTNIYVDKLGNDTTGDGTAQNPYKSIAKATSVGTSGNNIILGNGIWSEQRTLNSIAFKWWGNGMTEIDDSIVSFTIYSDTFNYFNVLIVANTSIVPYYCHYCNYVRVKLMGAYPSVFNGYYCNIYNTSVAMSIYGIPTYVHNCNIINCDGGAALTTPKTFYNNVIIGPASPSFSGIGCDYNNYTTLAIPTTGGANAHSINNASTGQTVADYFNSYNVTSPELSDFTAKAGSKNIRAGYGNGDIGFSQGFGRSASASEFTTAGGAILKGLSLVNGQIVLSQCNLFPQVATSNSITLDSSASAVDDHFKDLYIRITSGTGVGQLRLITAYNGTTKVATISGTWDTIPDSSSTYTCSGYLESADIDLGKIVKVKRNWFYGQFGYDLATVTGVYNQKTNATDNDYTNKTFVEFGMKFSKLNDLASKLWNAFSPNGANLFDGTYGDGESGYTIANGQYMIYRFIKIKFNVAI